MESIVIGLRDGTIGQLGEHQFVPQGAYKPIHYSWFIGFGSKGPRVWWEAFVHAAEFSRVKSLAARHEKWGVGFEDELMDITLRRDGRVWACYEVKWRRDHAERLVQQVREFGTLGITLDMPDRRNDPLRKAKYLVRHRPNYFSVLAIGAGLEFSVSYRTTGTRVEFDLLEDVIPFG